MYINVHVHTYIYTYVICISDPFLYGPGQSSLAVGTETAPNSPSDTLRRQILSQFSLFFSTFMDIMVAAVVAGGANREDSTREDSTGLAPQLPGRGEEKKKLRLSGHVRRCFINCCQLVCSLSSFELSPTNSEEKGKLLM